MQNQERLKESFPVLLLSVKRKTQPASSGEVADKFFWKHTYLILDFSPWKMPNGKLCHHVKEWPQVILSSHFLPNKHTKLKTNLHVLFLQTSTTLGDFCSYAYFQGLNLLEVWIYLSSNSSKDHRCCIFFRMVRDGVCQWTKNNTFIKSPFFVLHW